MPQTERHTNCHPHSYIDDSYLIKNLLLCILKQKRPQEKLEESVDTFSICTSSSTSVLDTSADTSFDKEQRKISAHATLQVGSDDIVPFVYDIIADT